MLRPFILLNLLAFVLCGQSALPAPDPIAQADAADELILRETLYRPMTAEEIYASEDLQDRIEKQVEEMFAAAHRRITRAEKRLEYIQAEVAAGRMKPESVRQQLDEVKRRIEVGYLASARSNLLKDIVNSARAERNAAYKATRQWVQKYNGNGIFSAIHYRAVSKAFLRQFGRAMPVSAEGDTRLHRALGFDHRGRVDVAVSPDSFEGRWLIRQLELLRIPYYAFRTAIMGRATGAHIHIGPGSLRAKAATARKT